MGAPNQAVLIIRASAVRFQHNSVAGGPPFTNVLLVKLHLVMGVAV
jgi:hypothetical protein